jgi:salicylate hydroxylase
MFHFGSCNATLGKYKHLPIAIVSGGLGSLVLAIELLRHGAKVHIYKASPVFSKFGAGVTFGAIASTALHLIHPRPLDEMVAHHTASRMSERTSKESKNWITGR